jgi:hypothetical protein
MISTLTSANVEKCHDVQLPVKSDIKSPVAVQNDFFHIGGSSVVAIDNKGA